GLDPEVVGDDQAGGCVRGGIEHVRLGGGDVGDQVDPVGARLGLRSDQQRRLVAAPERTGDRADVADLASEPPRVDPGDAGDVVRLEQGRQVPGAAVVALAAG